MEGQPHINGFKNLDPLTKHCSGWWKFKIQRFKWWVIKLKIITKKILAIPFVITTRGDEGLLGNRPIGWPEYITNVCSSVMVDR